MARPKLPETAKKERLTVTLDRKVKKHIEKQAKTNDKTVSGYLNDTHQPPKKGAKQ